MAARSFPACLIPAAAALFSACGKDDITTYRIPKEAPPEIAAAAQTGPGALAASSLAWTVPAGWKSRPATGMRSASFAVPAAGGECELSVVTLPGDAGGALANVNRWRGQLGEAALDAGSLAKAAGKVFAPAGTLLEVEINGAGGQAGEAMAAAILSTDENTWFFKLTGKGKAVAQARPSFLEFLRSLRPGTRS